MRITRISRLRDFGIFRDFTWSSHDLEDFSTYNLIYGWNASGKTTLSNLLQQLERSEKIPTTEGTATVRIDDRKVSAQDFDQEAVPIRVFNRKFIADSVFKIGGVAAGVDPIYLLGKDNVEKQKEVDVLKVSLGRTQTSVEEHQREHKDAIKALDDFCIAQAKHIKDTLGGGEANPYTNYNKSNFAGKADELSKEADIEGYKLDDNQRSILDDQRRASPKDKVDEIAYTFPDLSTLFDEVDALLARTVVSSTINALADDQELAKWVHEGLSLHRDRDSKTCLFCGNALPENRLPDLEAHFNKEYERFVNDIEKALATIADLSDAADEFFPPDKARLYDYISSEYDKALIACHAEVKQVVAALNLLQNKLEAKKNALFKTQSLTAQAPEIDKTVLDDANGSLRKHNKACDDFPTRVANARKKLEAGYVVDALEEYITLVNAKAAAKILLEKTRQTVGETKDKIALIERGIISPRQAADELNRDLRQYLGHDELSLQVEETGYRITRNGHGANELSEGERTAIALLYFLKSLKDKDFDLSSGIVVLDDPVSSLDANALFGAFGFIRDRTEDAAQLFVLTHNFAFFRQVHNWFRRCDASFYMLDCVQNENQRCASIQPLDPLLKKYESEYHYLFSRVYCEARASRPDGLGNCYYLPNVARRLLEAFLAFRYPQQSKKSLSEQLREIDYDANKKVRIERFLNAHSHRDAQFAGPEHDLSILGETPSVLQALLELMEKEDPKHYSAMVSLVNETHNTEATQGTQ